MIISYSEKELCLGKNKTPISKVVQSTPSPLYIYDIDLLKERANHFKTQFPEVNCHFAMKSNYNPRVLKTIFAAGFGADVVSIGEAKLAIEMGLSPQKIIFSGVGKTRQEITEALSLGIGQLNAESLSELARINALAGSLGQTVRVALRLNPDVEVKTHKYITTGKKDNKFGIDADQLPEILRVLDVSPNVKLVGLSVHLGSQIKDFTEYREGLLRIKEVFLSIKDRFQLEIFDFGGGMGIVYENSDHTVDYEILNQCRNVVFEVLGDLQKQGVQLQCEPGRWIVARSAGLVTEVQYLKHNGEKSFCICDSGMNHLMRPSLYDAYHGIQTQYSRSLKKKYDVVGPVCESSDFFAKDRELSEVQEGDLLLVNDTGAYGTVMASDYNLRGPIPEIFLDEI